MQEAVEKLVTAAEDGDLVGLRAALKLKAIRVNGFGSKGWTALHHAVTTPYNGTLVRELIDAKADPNQLSANSERYSPLHRAVAWNAGLSMIELLGELKADVCAVSDWGSTPLHYIPENHASATVWPFGENERVEMARYLLNQGGWTCLFMKDRHGYAPAANATIKECTQLELYYQQQTQALYDYLTAVVPVSPLVQVIVDYVYHAHISKPSN